MCGKCKAGANFTAGVSIFCTQQISKKTVSDLNSWEICNQKEFAFAHQKFSTNTEKKNTFYSGQRFATLSNRVFDTARNAAARSAAAIARKAGGTPAKCFPPRAKHTKHIFTEFLEKSPKNTHQHTTQSKKRKEKKEGSEEK